MRIMIEDKWIDNVPTSHYRIDDDAIRPLILACHGFESDRFSTVSDIALQLARRGFHVVTLDAYMHGERSEDRFAKANDQQKGEMIFEIILHTANDIANLMTDLKNEPLINSDSIGVCGVSMGGMISHLVASRHDDVTVVADLIGTPDYLTFIHDILEDDLEAYGEKIEELKTFNPIDVYLKTTPKAILLCHGRRDEVVPLNSVTVAHRQLLTHYEQCGEKSKIKFMKYFCKHEVLPEMKRSVGEWFESHLTVGDKVSNV